MQNGIERMYYKVPCRHLCLSVLFRQMVIVENKIATELRNFCYFLFFMTENEQVIPGCSATRVFTIITLKAVALLCLLCLCLFHFMKMENFVTLAHICLSYQLGPKEIQSYVAAPSSAESHSTKHMMNQ